MTTEDRKRKSYEALKLLDAGADYHRRGEFASAKSAFTASRELFVELGTYVGTTRLIINTALALITQRKRP